MAALPLFQSEIPGYPRRQGKVRDVYDLGDRLVIVASDRLSAFGWVMPTPIPDKGRKHATDVEFENLSTEDKKSLWRFAAMAHMRKATRK